MCLTEEYAIKDLTSVCRMQISLAKAPPIVEMTIIRVDVDLEAKINFIERRIKPYLPNLSKIPARIIDPATGASTWAFGSHRCTKNKGVLTKNATIVKNHQTFIRGALKKSSQLGKIKEIWCILVIISIREKSKGKDAVTVYKIRYSPACKRSG